MPVVPLTLLSCAVWPQGPWLLLLAQWMGALLGRKQWCRGRRGGGVGVQEGAGWAMAGLTYLQQEEQVTLGAGEVVGSCATHLKGLKQPAWSPPSLSCHPAFAVLLLAALGYHAGG